VLLAESVDDVRARQHPLLLLLRQPVLNVRILEDLVHATTGAVLAQQVCHDHVLLRRPREKERERILKERAEPEHASDCIVALVQASADRGRFAERMLHGVDDAGNEERVNIWIERKAGAVWAVGRAVNPHERNTKAPRRDDYIFEGYELEDALEQANAALEDDLTVSEADGRPEHLRPFTRDECLKPLEAWFFGRTQ
jgi:hypothetical protein